jgi:hypothetical protein
MSYQDMIVKTLQKDWSPTKLGTFRTCPKKFDFQYVQRIPGKQNSAAFLGNCVHIAIQTHFLASVSGDLIIQETEDIFKGEFMQYSEKNIYGQDVPFEAIDKDYSMGIALLNAYKPTLQALIAEGTKQYHDTGALPECEHKVNFAISPEGEILPYREKSEENIGVFGKIDLLMPNGMVMDIKTASRAKQKEDVSYSLQFGLYSAYMKNIYLKTDQPVQFQVHTITKTKEIKVQILTAEYGDAEILDIIQQAKAISNAVRNIKSTNDFMVNPNMLCKNYCDYKDLCSYGKRLCNEPEA